MSWLLNNYDSGIDAVLHRWVKIGRRPGLPTVLRQRFADPGTAAKPDRFLRLRDDSRTKSPDSPAIKEDVGRFARLKVPR